MTHITEKDGKWRLGDGSYIFQSKNEAISSYQDLIKSGGKSFVDKYESIVSKMRKAGVNDARSAAIDVFEDIEMDDMLGQMDDMMQGAMANESQVGDESEANSPDIQSYESYPWNKCISDQKKKYGSLKKAQKICGSIRAKYG